MNNRNKVKLQLRVYSVSFFLDKSISTNTKKRIRVLWVYTQHYIFLNVHCFKVSLVLWLLDFCFLFRSMSFHINDFDAVFGIFFFCSPLASSVCVCVCVWAYVCHNGMLEAKKKLTGKILVEYHFFEGRKFYFFTLLQAMYVCVCVSYLISLNEND